MSSVQAAPKGKMNGMEWSTGLCDCFSDCGSCCMGFWCLCVLYGKNTEKLTGEDCFCPCLTFYALSAFTGCVCCIAGPTRKQLRAKYQLKEAPCGDCLIHCCCVPCGVCQEARELNYRGAQTAPVGAYSAPQGQTMTMPPNQQYPPQQTYDPQQQYPSAQKF